MQKIHQTDQSLQVQTIESIEADHLDHGTKFQAEEKISEIKT